MKKMLVLLTVMTVLAGGSWWMLSGPQAPQIDEQLWASLAVNPDNALVEKMNRAEEEPRKGPELEKWFFEQWHQPYGNVLPRPVMDHLMSTVEQFPRESEISDDPSVVGWVSAGPNGMSVPGSNAVYSGRVLDIDVHSSGQILAAAASGGLWRIDGTTPVPIGDGAGSLVVSSVATSSSNANIIFITTGEPGVRAGNGVWITTDAGANWTESLPLSPEPGAYYRIRHTPGNTAGYFYHLVSDLGYYRSVGGVAWTQVLAGNTTDLVVDPSDNNIMYTSKWGEDIVWKTVDGGTTWVPFVMVNAAGGLITNTARVSFAVSGSNSSVVYMAAAESNTNFLKGVYKSANGGITWTDISPPENYMGNQGWYDNVIAVNPADDNVLVVGGVDMWRTTNGGSNWTKVSNPNVHPDHHALVWVPGTNRLYSGHDGGVAYSTDGGSSSWTTSGLNNMAITQYVNIDVCPDNLSIIDGGSQDNGHSLTTDGGQTWRYVIGGDGGGVIFDPANCARMWITNGVYGNAWAFNRLRSTDSGASFSFINNGVDASGQWYHKIRHDQVTPVYLYNNSGPWVYESRDGGDNWGKLNSTAFATQIFDMTVSRFSGSSGVVYACMADLTPGNRLWVYDGGTWYERSSPEFPADVFIRKVTPHPTNPDVAYLVMNGISVASIGKQVWKTTNRGVSWTNITGGLPLLTRSEVLAHPTDDNLLYQATELGMWRSTDGGTLWLPWGTGMPANTIVSELKYVNKLATENRFFIVAGTYGRGIYIREINDNPITGVGEEPPVVVEGYQLEQNYPNPFNPTTAIRFSLAQSQHVELKVYDLNGRSVATLVDGPLAAGEHNLTFDGANFASGVYFYRITAGNFTQTKRMTLVK
ncbi:MAG: T9SS type A sorting domain-containing protein [Calditrichaeota bacterium]|nr:T9SS type A sorting domain-containing protein [Calditrichota bacterium]